MNEHTFNNSSCGSDVDFVGYLYNEIDAGGKLAVEDHLVGCDPCRQEFAALASTVRAVSDWNTEEFKHLVTPAFEFEPDAKAAVPAWSVWSALRAFRFQVPLLASAVVVLVLAAVFFFRSTPSEQQNVIATAPAVAPSGPDGSLPRGPSNVPKSETVARVNPVEDKRNLAPDSENHRTRKPAARPQAVQQDAMRTARYRSPVPSDRSLASGKQSKPDLNGFEDSDDETLRLGDIFSEIDAS